MPNFNAHCAISKQRTGFDFAELHEWIDSPSEYLGSDHRIERHAYTKEDMLTVKSFWERKKPGWGDKAIVEWLFHIAIDNMSTALKFARQAYGPNAYNVAVVGIKDSGFIEVEFDRETDREIDQLFKDLRR